MEQQLYVDGIDVYARYGVFVTEQGLDELVAFAPLKPVKSIDWQEEDGIEADLSDPKLNSRELTLRFAGPGEGLRGLLGLLASAACRTYTFPQLGRSYRLRMVSHATLDVQTRPGLAAVRLADDFPLEGYAYKAPESTIPASDDYWLDERRLTDYGVRVLAGTLDQVEKLPAVKQNLLRNIATQNGAIYDGERVTFKAKEVPVKCLMRAATLDELWRNYDALLYDLVRPGERLLHAELTGEEYPCHYKSCSVNDFHATGKIWLAFTLTLVFTSFRVEGIEYLLSTESGERVVTEDGIYAIDLKEIELWQ